MPIDVRDRSIVRAKDMFYGRLPREVEIPNEPVVMPET